MKPEATYSPRFLFYLLWVVLLGVWSQVIFSVNKQINRNEFLLVETQSVARIKHAPASGELPAFQPYRSDFKDPFEPAASLFLQPRRATHEKKRPEKKESKKAQQFPITLQGITGITATMIGKNDLVYFVKSGDLVEGVKIIKVEHDKVHAKFENKSITLKLNP